MKFSDPILAIDDLRMRRRHDQICGSEKNLLGREDADAKVFMAKLKVTASIQRPAVTDQTMDSGGPTRHM